MDFQCEAYGLFENFSLGDGQFPIFGLVGWSCGLCLVSCVLCLSSLPPTPKESFWNNPSNATHQNHSRSFGWNTMHVTLYLPLFWSVRLDMFVILLYWQNILVTPTSMVSSPWYVVILLYWQNTLGDTNLNGNSAFDISTKVGNMIAKNCYNFW